MWALLLALNVLAFGLYGLDKRRARSGRRRIRERTLLLVAALGGSAGAWLGMRLWHHKTLHWKFRLGLPLILVVQVGRGRLVAGELGVSIGWGEPQ